MDTRQTWTINVYAWAYDKHWNIFKIKWRILVYTWCVLPVVTYGSKTRTLTTQAHNQLAVTQTNMTHARTVGQTSGSDIGRVTTWRPYDKKIRQVVEQITCILGWIVQIVIQAPKLPWGISMVIKSILPDGPIKNPIWRPFSKMDTHKINLRHKAGPIWTN